MKTERKNEFRFAIRLWIIFCMLFVGLQNLQAQSFITENGYAEFESSAPLLTFKGTSEHLNGLIDLDENLIDFYIDMTTVDTGINLRNRHMRESYLETDTYPFAEFTGKMVTPFDRQSDEIQDVSVEGEFTIHGVTRQMNIEGTLRRSGDSLELNASWTVLLEDHKIRRPRVVFYELADEQKVIISAVLNKHEN